MHIKQQSESENCTVENGLPQHVCLGRPPCLPRQLLPCSTSANRSDSSDVELRCDSALAAGPCILRGPAQADFNNSMITEIGDLSSIENEKNPVAPGLPSGQTSYSRPGKRGNRPTMARTRGWSPSYSAHGLRMGRGKHSRATSTHSPQVAGCHQEDLRYRESRSHWGRMVDHFQFWILNSIEFQMNMISRRLTALEKAVSGSEQEEEGP